MSTRPRPTRSPATVARYESDALELFRMYGSTQKITGRTGTAADVAGSDILGIISGKTTGRRLFERQLEPSDYREFVGWLGTQRENWTQATWRLRRQQVSHWFETRPHDENDEAFALLVDISKNTKAKPKRQGETSAHKPKSIPHEDWVALNKQLTTLGLRGNYKYAYATRAWLHANILLGLRPVEWVGTTIEPVSEPDDNGMCEFLVTTPNAKTTNGRGTGKFRQQQIVLSAEQATVVANHLEVVDGLCAGGDSEEEKIAIWRDFERRCGRVLKSVCEKLWPDHKRKRYTLYSARHQYSANQKNEHDLESVAELMGHAASKSTKRHYGRRRKGWDAQHRTKATPVGAHRPAPKRS